MEREPMVSLVWPNGHTGATRKSMAERLVKKNKARYLKDVQKETSDKETKAEAKAAAAKAAADKKDKE